MRAHHVGGIHMADAASAATDDRRVSTLATRMTTTQTYEIAIFDQLLTTTYAAD